MREAHKAPFQRQRLRVVLDEADTELSLVRSTLEGGQGDGCDFQDASL